MDNKAEMLFPGTSRTDSTPSQDQKLGLHKQTKTFQVRNEYTIKTEINHLLLLELSVLNTKHPPKGCAF